MKTVAQINEARNKVVEQFMSDKLSKDQRLFFAGLSVALCWVAEVGGETLQQLIDGRPVDRGKTLNEASQRDRNFFLEGKISKD